MASAVRPPTTRLRRVATRMGQAICMGGILGYGYYNVYLPWRDPRNVPNQLHPDYFRHFTLLSRTQVTRDTQLLRFQHTLDHSTLPVAPISSVDIKDPTMQVKRSFTPIHTKHTEDNPESFEILVKKYPLASVSQMLHHTDIGDTVEIRGPYQEWEYTPNRWKSIGMVAGGTGITPMWQLIRHILADPSDHTKLTLIYANRSVADIPLRTELEALQAAFPDRLTLQFVVDRDVEPGTTKPTLGNHPVEAGYVSRALLHARLPPARNDTMVLVSGPAGMMRHICGEKRITMEQGPVTGLLHDLGYTSKNVFKL
ncbi:hypothetical protein IWQ62_002727 [Dispira parvispora]|uniref:cytochrome-b5 reductase n=1 Tax=Dispira parvispora TaxID=1520584 RepID=A0A9W8AQR0_9FUNG|nr:hypothetical protein IWQ62_002727 [Dispira parvispora]